ncbi:MAG TPA: hydrolase TatD [Gammaproteobacteria bacterium]|nr:hydrolase TatD [Gammaproteobacteria bacterium]MEC8009709.1 TatD family hydrolase [Pseudomonadota bacterium]HBF07624.1 hydrolase TatD [Gammaproteobacteria bacterium]HCK93299.1 hydrolase TatD [Gammaproteobacteria bacterium]|tara:strand:+ start:1298 stop:2080 length:783 start_codon:yes stop_codon:yes gene_type:complete
MIDIGINLASDSFDNDREQVIQDGLEAGVSFFILTGSCPKSNTAVKAFAHKHSDITRATAGIHPHHADDVTNSVIADVRTHCEDPLVAAVGETGLDFFRDLSDRKKQQKAFEAHLQIAIELQKPIFLHQRESHDTFLPIIKEYRDQLTKAVVHCFTDEKRALYDYLDLDLHIGITGWIADERRGTHLVPLVADIPWNRLMIETDGPYLLPRNIRPKPKSRRNEPKYLPYVAAKVAESRQVEVSKVIEETTRTAKEFFNIP